MTDYRKGERVYAVTVNQDGEWIVRPAHFVKDMDVPLIFHTETTVVVLDVLVKLRKIERPVRFSANGIFKSRNDALGKALELQGDW